MNDCIGVNIRTVCCEELERTDIGMERSVMERDVREERERDPIGSRDLDAGYEQAWR